MSKSAPSPASDCGTSTASGSLLAVDSSILSDTLSNIDFNDFLGLDSDTSSSSDSTPMVPWNMRAGTRNEGGNTLVTQTYSLANNSPRLNHFEWRSGQATQPKRRRRNSNPNPDQGRVVKGKGKRSKGTAGIPMCESEKN